MFGYLGAMKIMELICTKEEHVSINYHQQLHNTSAKKEIYHLLVFRLKDLTWSEA